MSDKNIQQLHASNQSTNIAEALEARTKDPLWLLARQWQTGEFEAENGGKPSEVAVQARHWGFEQLSMENTVKALDTSVPLEANVEAETIDGDSPAWKSEALEYEFGISAGAHQIHATGYDGRQLDWYHFDYAGSKPATAPKTQTQRVIPTQMFLRGTPHSRWWRMEDGGDYFDTPVDSEPNVLSLLLPEFSLIDVDNWYVVPLSLQSGSIHEVRDISIVDSFGTVSSINSASSASELDDFSLFTLSGEGLGGKYMVMPNIAADILNSDELEEVRFLRDEQANLVWAWEYRLEDDEGGSFTTNQEISENVDSNNDTDQEVLRFIFKSPTAQSWIPYLPRQIDHGPSLGDIHLRRGRTDEKASLQKPQHRSRIVSESATLFEEEIPPRGLRVRRIRRSAVDSRGQTHYWVGREVGMAQSTSKPRIQFDYLE